MARLINRLLSHQTAEKVLFCLYVIPLLLAMIGSVEGTMSVGNWTDVATAISGIVSAVGAAVAAGAAFYAALLAKQASDTWLKGIKQQRIDEAIMAVLEVHSKAYRILALMEANAPKKDVSDAYTDAWSSCNRFEQTYQVARRYSQSLSSESPKQFDALLEKLRNPCRDYDLKVGISDNANDLVEEINKLAAYTADALRAGANAVE